MSRIDFFHGYFSLVKAQPAVLPVVPQLALNSQAFLFVFGMDQQDVFRCIKGVLAHLEAEAGCRPGRSAQKGLGDGVVMAANDQRVFLDTGKGQFVWREHTSLPDSQGLDEGLVDRFLFLLNHHNHLFPAHDIGQNRRRLHSGQLPHEVVFLVQDHPGGQAVQLEGKGLFLAVHLHGQGLDTGFRMHLHRDVENKGLLFLPEGQIEYRGAVLYFKFAVHKVERRDIRAVKPGVEIRLEVLVG